MARITPNIVLQVWDLLSDRFSHTELASNWDNIAAHDHTTGKGLQIPTGGIANTAVTTGKLADNAVTTAKITDANVTGAKIAAGAVDGSKISAGTIDNTKIADGTIITTKIADANVTTAKIADGAVTPDKIPTAFAQQMGITNSTNISRAQIVTSTAQNMPVDVLGSLPTPDKVSVVVPGGGIVAVSYYARHIVGGATSGSCAGASLYLGGVEVQQQSFNGGFATGETVISASTTGTVTGSVMTNTDLIQGATPLYALSGTNAAFAGAVPAVFAIGNWLLLDVVPGGTFDVEVRWRRLSVRSTSGTVQDRRLRVMTWAV